MGDALRREIFAVAADPESMAARLIQFTPTTDAEALKLLRSSFPDCPLSMRVAALNFLLQRRPREIGGCYNPR
jgi:hypothetical protein